MGHCDPRDYFVVSYFVTPVTTIICKHLADSRDATRHVVDVHKKCSKRYYDAFMKMVHQGIINSDIIATLLEDRVQQIPIPLHLMINYGLIEPLQIAQQQAALSKSNKSATATTVAASSGKAVQSSKSTKKDEYLVPALLPILAEGVATAASAGKGGTMGLGGAAAGIEWNEVNYTT